MPASMFKQDMVGECPLRYKLKFCYITIPNLSQSLTRLVMAHWMFNLPSDLNIDLSSPCVLLSIASGSAYLLLSDLISKLFQRH